MATTQLGDVSCRSLTVNGTTTTSGTGTTSGDQTFTGAVTLDSLYGLSGNAYPPLWNVTTLPGTRLTNATVSPGVTTLPPDQHPHTIRDPGSYTLRLRDGTGAEPGAKIVLMAQADVAGPVLFQRLAANILVPADGIAAGHVQASVPNMKQGSYLEWTWNGTDSWVLTSSNLTPITFS
jgi:hypothetical protein